MYGTLKVTFQEKTRIIMLPLQLLLHVPLALLSRAIHGNAHGPDNHQQKSNQSKHDDRPYPTDLRFQNKPPCSAVRSTPCISSFYY